MLLLKFLTIKLRAMLTSCKLGLKKADLFRHIMPWSVWFFCAAFVNSVGAVLSAAQYFTYLFLMLACYTFIHITVERNRFLAYLCVLFGGVIMATASLIIDENIVGNPISGHTLWIPFFLFFFIPFGYTLRDVVSRLIVEYREFAAQQARIPSPLKPAIF